MLSFAARGHSRVTLPPEVWLIWFTVLLGVFALGLLTDARQVLTRRRARRWPAVEAVITQTASRDGSPLVRYRTADGVLRSAPVADGRDALAGLAPGASILVHPDPHDPQRLLTETAVRSPGARELWRPGLVVLGVLAVDALILLVLGTDPARAGWSHIAR